MRVLTDSNGLTYFDIRDYDGRISNHRVFIYSKPGYGKTLSMESLIEEFHRAGHTVLILSDIKDQFELGFAMFPPERPYHLMQLRKKGKPIEVKKVKLYHPFTFNVPKNVSLPEINFYGCSLKELGRSEWSLIIESAWESDTVRLLLNSSSSIGDNEGLYGFLHFIENSIFGKRKGKELKPDPKSFYLRTTGGTAKSLQDVASYFLPFKKHYFLVPHNSPLKLDWLNILNDNLHYHVFSTCFIKDEKLKEFCILVLLNSIVESISPRGYGAKIKKPILIVIPEIRFLVPYNPEGYKKFLADGVSKAIISTRNMGRGISVFCDSQSWTDVAENVRNSTTHNVFGEIGGGKDIENITKSIRGGSEMIQHLRSSEYEHSFLEQKTLDLGGWNFWLPGHCHSEEGYNFFELYKKHYPKKMKNYNNLIDTMKKQFSDEESKFIEKIKRRQREEKEKKEKESREKEERKSKKEKVDDKMEKVKEVENKSKQQIMKLCYEMKQEKPKMSWRELGRRMGFSSTSGHTTAKKYFEEYSKIVEEKENEDFEDKVVEDLEGENQQEQNNQKQD